MKIHRSYRTELDPNNKQKTYLEKSFGVSRFAYNWGLDFAKKRYESGEKHPSAIELHKELCSRKKTEFPWMYEVSKIAPQNALRNLDKAYKRFFQNVKQNKNPGYPKFKSKHNSRQSFTIDDCMLVQTFSDRIQLPKCKTKIRLKHKDYIPTSGVKLIQATVTKEAGRYFVAVTVETEIPEPNRSGEEVIGVDLGIKELATCSDGVVFHNPKNTRKYKKKLRRAQRSLSRKKKGSWNREKQKLKVQKIHLKIKNSRKDNIHKMTSTLTKTKCRVVVIEDLNIKGMLKNRKLAKSIFDASFGEIRRQLEYKTRLYGGELFVIDRWFPSSKLCSSCGQLKEKISLSERTYICDCGLNIDRDINASYNIKNYYLNQSVP